MEMFDEHGMSHILWKDKKSVLLLSTIAMPIGFFCVQWMWCHEGMVSFGKWQLIIQCMWNTPLMYVELMLPINSIHPICLKLVARVVINDRHGSKDVL